MVDSQFKNYNKMFKNSNKKNRNNKLNLIHNKNFNKPIENNVVNYVVLNFKILSNIVVSCTILCNNPLIGVIGILLK
jgi:hypothetical protein